MSGENIPVTEDEDEAFRELAATLARLTTRQQETARIFNAHEWGR